MIKGLFCGGGRSEIYLSCIWAETYPVKPQPGSEQATTVNTGGFNGKRTHAAEVTVLTMNSLKSVLPCISRRVTSVLTMGWCQSNPTFPLCKSSVLANQCVSRSLSSQTLGCGNKMPQTAAFNSIASSGVLLSKINTMFHQPVRFYKVKRVLRLRCKGCYFEKRFGRLYVECSLKPRHKQMKLVNKHYLYKDDYSEGDISRAAHWYYRRDRFYRLGYNKYSRYNWLEGRLGTEV